jgi:aminoglycoside phosphotransferase (APT) family kinase protein
MCISECKSSINYSGGVPNPMPAADVDVTAVLVRRWLHGDLHPANILVSHGRVSGVIDFGDITAGDPATDLAVAWMLLPLGHHAAFRSAYRSARADPAGSAEDAGSTALWTRARGWALNLAIVFLAHSADNPQLLNVGRRTLSRVLAQ